MSLCVAAAGKVLVVAASLFTLSWEHSVEKTRWEEDWRLTTAGLEIVVARVKGSGAGMEPPEDSVLENGWWVYEPELPVLPELVLAASGATRSGWRLCADGDCHVIGGESGEAIVLRPCAR